ncbi:FIMAH domain-containing protein [Anaerobaca lacustris]|uniref:FIMAH domain-containing protein n=1 Tax=Anaerobaca lacustris TaxID=3044600 RepID=A0AAW6TTV1_9BACT|nr:hypothetical protein [Sedimentisphaerales bacterium M17dextr]
MNAIRTLQSSAILVAVLLTAAFGQMGQAKIKVCMTSGGLGSWHFDGHTNYTFQGKDSDLDRLSISIARTGAASGDWSCWVTPDTVPWSDGMVQIGARLKNYRFDDLAGMKDLHVATVTLFAGKSSDPDFERVVLDTIPVVMDVGYHLLAERGPGGSAGGEILLHQLPENMPPQEFSHALADPGYVFTGWTGQGVDLGCVLSYPDRPNVWRFDFWRYFIELGQTKQVYLLATFAPANTPVAEDVVVPVETPDGVVTIQFDAVVEAGHTEVSVSSSGPMPPAGFRMGEPPVYYDITTTADYAGDIVICISYDPSTFEGPLDSLRLLHYEDGEWVDCTILPIDETAHVICGVVSSLSPFIVVERIAPPCPAERLEELIAIVAELDLPRGTKNSLSATLNAALRSLERGHTKPAISQLGAFINQVKAQRGKAIAQGTADALVATAQQVIDLLKDMS